MLVFVLHVADDKCLQNMLNLSEWSEKDIYLHPTLAV